MRRAGRQDHGLVQRGIERLEIIQGNFGQLRRQRHVNVPADVDALKIRVVFDLGQVASKRLGTGHDVLDCLELGHVKLGLHRHVQVGVGGAEHESLIF